MNLESKILRLLLEPKFKYKGISVSLLGVPDLGLYKKQTIKNAVTNLKRKGYITDKKDGFSITQHGRKYVTQRMSGFEYFSHKYSKDAPKNLIVMYDIPEEQKAEREWFRWHLRKFCYAMIQRSVWVGPAPLPKEFVEYAKSLKLKDTIKVMRLAKPYGEDSFRF